jgi:hypothetical protein
MSAYRTDRLRLVNGVAGWTLPGSDLRFIVFFGALLSSFGI